MTDTDKIIAEIDKLRGLYEKDTEVITDTNEMAEVANIMFGLDQAKAIVRGDTAEQLY